MENTVLLVWVIFLDDPFSYNQPGLIASLVRDGAIHINADSANDRSCQAEAQHIQPTLITVEKDHASAGQL